MNKRVVSVDILKVFAVILVINSHMEVCYHPYEFLATGGAIGDALFFFCSGFTLLLGQSKADNFFNYYKRRINRIYPTVFVVAIITELLFNQHHDVWSLFVFGGGWFVTCLMIYYAFFYFIREYGLGHLKYVLLAAFVISILCFFLFYDYEDEYSMYYKTYYKWIFNFNFMLVGAIIGRKHKSIKASGFKDVMMLALCIILWYAIMISMRKWHFIMDIQYISLLPLTGICYYSYRICTFNFWESIYSHRIWGQIIFVTGGICLESYLIQGYLFTDRFNNIFPLNIPLVFLIVVFSAYVVKVFSNFYMQTFQEKEYNWRDILYYKKA